MSELKKQFILDRFDDDGIEEDDELENVKKKKTEDDFDMGEIPDEFLGDDDGDFGGDEGYYEM